MAWWRHQWKHFPRYWPFVRGIHRSPLNSPHKGQWRGPFMFSLICVWTNDWVNNREAGDLRRYRAHYDVIVTVCRLLGVKRLSELISLRYNSKFTHFHLRKRFKMQGIGHFGGASMCWYKWWKEWAQTFAIQIYDHISWYPGNHGRHSITHIVNFYTNDIHTHKVNMYKYALHYKFFLKLPIAINAHHHHHHIIMMNINSIIAVLTAW